MASFATMGDSGDIDISDLLMVRRYTIERSRAQRLQNRAFMFAAEELRPPELQVLAMTIMPWFNPLEGNWGDDPEITFHSQVGESRKAAGSTFKCINGATNDRYSHVYGSGYPRTPITSWQRRRELHQRHEEEMTILNARIAESPCADNEQGLPTPIPGQGYQEGLPFSTTKFLVFCTVPIPTSVLNTFLEDATKGGVDIAGRTAGLALLTDANLEAPYYATSSVPSTYKAPETFLDRDSDYIHDEFLQLTAPLDGAPSFFGMHAFVILDAVTAADGGQTCYLACEHLDENYVIVRELQRAETKVALAHLICAEMLYVSLEQAAWYTERGDDLLTSQMFMLEDMNAEDADRIRSERLMAEDRAAAAGTEMW